MKKSIEAKIKYFQSSKKININTFKKNRFYRHQKCDLRLNIQQSDSDKDFYKTLTTSLSFNFSDLPYYLK